MWISGDLLIDSMHLCNFLFCSPHRGLIIHISAENCKFLQIADELEMMKPTRSGVMKNFNISCLDDFFINDAMAIDNVLTVADRQMIIKCMP